MRAFLMPWYSVVARTAAVWRKASQLGWALVVESALELIRARLLTLLPAPWYFSELGTPVAAPLSRGSSDAAAANSVGRAIGIMTRRLPIGAKCLQQAMAARRMLRRRQIPATVSIGVSRTVSASTAGSNRSAHAWVTVGDQVICGGGGLDSYAVIAELD